MTCGHNFIGAGEGMLLRTTARITPFHICDAALELRMVGRCEHRRQWRDCRSRPATCASAFPASPAARRWASCDDVATLRKRGEAYERAWVKATARELDLMIEIERLKREVDREKSLRFGEYERSWIAEQEAMLASEDPEEREDARRSLAANKCKACCGTGLVNGEWLIDPTDPRHDNPPLCPCQNLENA